MGQVPATYSPLRKACIMADDVFNIEATQPPTPKPLDAYARARVVYDLFNSTSEVEDSAEGNVVPIK